MYDRLMKAISPHVVASTNPPGFRADCPRIFLLDEIQESESWRRWLKSAVDESRRAGPDTRSYFVATGSSAATLRTGSVESGQGRWDELTVEGLTFREFLTLNAPRSTSASDADPTLASRDPSLFPRYLTSGGFPEHARNVTGVDPLPSADTARMALQRLMRRRPFSRRRRAVATPTPRSPALMSTSASSSRR